MTKFANMKKAAGKSANETNTIPTCSPSLLRNARPTSCQTLCLDVNHVWPSRNAFPDQLTFSRTPPNESEPVEVQLLSPDRACPPRGSNSPVDGRPPPRAERRRELNIRWWIASLLLKVSNFKNQIASTANYKIKYVKELSRSIIVCLEEWDASEQNMWTSPFQPLFGENRVKYGGWLKGHRCYYGEQL